MADALSLLCSNTVVMLAATYWTFYSDRPHGTIAVLIIAVLTIALFATHYTVVNMHASPIELACGTARENASFKHGDPFDLPLFRFIPFGFSAWCLALIGTIFQHPTVIKHKPKRGERGHRLWSLAQWLPNVFGMIGLVVYAIYFFNTWTMMKDTYGESFTKGARAWGFGQYLAAFTFLPSILTFGHLFFSKSIRSCLSSLFSRISCIGISTLILASKAVLKTWWKQEFQPTGRSLSEIRPMNPKTELLRRMLSKPTHQKIGDGKQGIPTVDRDHEYGTRFILTSCHNSQLVKPIVPQDSITYHLRQINFLCCNYRYGFSTSPVSR